MYSQEKNIIAAAAVAFDDDAAADAFDDDDSNNDALNTTLGGVTDVDEAIAIGVLVITVSITCLNSLFFRDRTSPGGTYCCCCYHSLRRYNY